MTVSPAASRARTRAPRPRRRLRFPPPLPPAPAVRLIIGLVRSSFALRLPPGRQRAVDSTVPTHIDLRHRHHPFKHVRRTLGSFKHVQGETKKAFPLIIVPALVRLSRHWR